MNMTLFRTLHHSIFRLKAIICLAYTDSFQMEQHISLLSTDIISRCLNQVLFVRTWLMSSAEPLYLRHLATYRKGVLYTLAQYDKFLKTN
jgi:hypothetical protein